MYTAIVVLCFGIQTEVRDPSKCCQVILKDRLKFGRTCNIASICGTKKVENFEYKFPSYFANYTFTMLQL